MKDTKNIEYAIMYCFVQYKENIDLDFKYFKYSKQMAFIKKLRDAYNELDWEVIEKYVKDGNKYKAFVDDVINASAEFNFNENIGELYKLLIETYKSNQIIQAQNNYSSGLITREELQNTLLSQDDLENAPLTLDMISKSQRIEREYTNIKELDYLTKGIEYGSITIWTGVTNAGKTTLVTQFARECLQNNKKIFFFAGEQTAYQFKNALYLTMCKKEEIIYIADEHNNSIRDYMPTPSKTAEFDTKYHNKVYLYNNDLKSHNLASIMGAMEQCIKLGVRIFFIDNFMQIENTEKLEEQTNIMEQLKQFAMRNKIIVNLVVHPRKTMSFTSRLSIFDISGSQNISNKATNIITIMRTDTMGEEERKNISKELAKNNYDIDECNAIIEVVKTKGNACKMVGLKYNHEIKVYEETTRKYDLNQAKRRI